MFALLCGSACVDVSEPDVMGDRGTHAMLVDEASAIAETGDGDGQPHEICGLLPPDGACSLACDPEALSEQYVPPGVCVAFVCTLTDGRSINVHACHPGDH